jgi:5-methylcytosine-specific restriction endonuclease McrA
MLIILSQRIDFDSDYEDVPFSIYHFPKRYRNQIHPGDCFIYYQGDRHKKGNRYYFGCGVIGDVFSDSSGDFYYAKILEGKAFRENVPIYNPDGGFWESIGYEQVRKNSNPPWQNSIRRVSEEAFNAILDAAGIEKTIFDLSSNLEIISDSIDVLRTLNDRYRGLRPKDRAQKVSTLLDRGASITKALKNILGTKCQICNWKGFEKVNGQNYIEAHHLNQISARCSDSLCTENIILLCPNCHSEIHYGNNVKVFEDKDFIIVRLSATEAKIHKNYLSYLEKSTKDE